MKSAFMLHLRQRPRPLFISTPILHPMSKIRNFITLHSNSNHISKPLPFTARQYSMPFQRIAPHFSTFLVATAYSPQTFQDSTSAHSIPRHHSAPRRQNITKHSTANQIIPRRHSTTRHNSKSLRFKIFHVIAILEVISLHDFPKQHAPRRQISPRHFTSPQSNPRRHSNLVRV